MSVSLTDSAADRVRSFLTSRGHGVGLRLGVKKTGCSGFAYVVNYADEVGADDVVFDSPDVRWGGTGWWIDRIAPWSARLSISHAR